MLRYRLSARSQRPPSLVLLNQGKLVLAGVSAYYGKNIVGVINSAGVERMAGGCNLKPIFEAQTVTQPFHNSSKTVPDTLNPKA
jgi:hypothetical protein